MKVHDFNDSSAFYTRCNMHNAFTLAILLRNLKRNCLYGVRYACLNMHKIWRKFLCTAKKKKKNENSIKNYPNCIVRYLNSAVLQIGNNKKDPKWIRRNPLWVYYMTQIWVLNKLEMDQIITYFGYTMRSKLGILQILDFSI